MILKENMSSHFSVSAQRIRRSPYQTLAAISIMTMTLFLDSVFTLVAAGSQAVLKYFETRPQINAFFKTDYVPTTQEVERITTELNSTGLIESVKYISKEEALKIYKDLNQSDPLLLEAVTSAMLPASIEVSTKDPNDLRQLAVKLKGETNIDDVRFAEDIVSALTTWTSSVRTIGVALVGAHITITFVVILLIIGIKVASRRDEITILQLVGATPGYISAPFVWEGILYGLIGAVCAWGTTYILLLYSMPFLVSFLAGIPILPPPILFMLELLLGEVLLGILVGGLGGWFAARRFLKT
jgi:cell division transport system permease protein